jgi:YbbR domain-containing protein
MIILRWLGKNISTLILAFVIALVVWVSAVTAADPNLEQNYPRPVQLEIVGLEPGLLIRERENLPNNILVTLNAPRSIWTRLITQDQPIQAYIDLTDLDEGQHTVPVQIRRPTNIAPVRVIQRTPTEVTVVLEPEISRTFPVTLIIDGEPALGYQAGDPVYNPTEVVVTGAQSTVMRVEEVRAYLDISGVIQTVETALALDALDENDQSMNRITITPNAIEVRQPINLLGGYRNVIVKAVYTGQVANGYKLTHITVTPPSIVVFSPNLELLNELPGYIETEPLDLTDASNDLEAFLDLNLPEEIEVPNDQRVLVQVGVAAIESNLAVSLPVEAIGLARGLSAQVAPQSVDIIFSGPLTVLDNLKPSDIRVVVDLAGHDVGTYHLSPRVTFLPESVRIESILPSTLEIMITIAPTPTTTPTPATPSS